jgi:Protein of unknown function (DUF2510)/Matrixin
MPRRRGSKPDTPRAPGWYPDPWSATGEGERYFDGRRWGSNERPLGREATVVPMERRRDRRLHSVRQRPQLIIAILVLVALAFLIARLQQGGNAHGSTNGAAADHPPPSSEERARPIGTPAPVPAGTGGFEFMRTQAGTQAQPVAFDPCRPVHYVVNLAGAPSDASALLSSAIARVQTATGLQFVFDGTTDEQPDKQRPLYQPSRYDKRWAPVLIAWSDEAAYPELAGYIAGIGGADAVSGRGNRLVYVTGEVVLDRQQLSTAAMPDRALVEATLLHELGHLVGLDHTSDRRQIMFSESEFDVRDYGVGDLRGLAALGTQACFPGT